MKKLSSLLIIPFTVALLSSCTTVKEPAPAASTTTTSTDQVQTPASSTTTVTHQSGNY
ncbi:MAG TPA: hypothetical protein VGG02_01820 [Chthoniobacterales bacterium]|jgi:ABC-type Fe3+-hydroxamate transport system substrate-binding protein